MSEQSPEPKDSHEGALWFIIAVLVIALIWQCKPERSGEYVPEEDLAGNARQYR